MNKIISTLFLGIYLAVFPLNNVSAAPEPQKIAIVDTQKILTSSTQLKNLKSNSETKNKELIELIKKAQAEINKQTDAKQKKVIAEKYEKQIVAKRNANAKEYTTKLREQLQNGGYAAIRVTHDRIYRKKSVKFGHLQKLMKTMQNHIQNIG